MHMPVVAVAWQGARVSGHVVPKGDGVAVEYMCVNGGGGPCLCAGGGGVVCFTCTHDSNAVHKGCR